LAVLFLIRSARQATSEPMLQHVSEGYMIER